MNTVIARLKEKSTITVVITIALGFIGVELSPENKDTIVNAIIVILGLIGTFWGQDHKTD